MYTESLLAADMLYKAIGAYISVSRRKTEMPSSTRDHFYVRVEQE